MTHLTVSSIHPYCSDDSALQAQHADTQWMTSGLPPLDCPLVIRIRAGTFSDEMPGPLVHFTLGDYILRVERRQPAPNKNADLSYWTEDGVCFTGKFEWSYP